MIALLMRSGMGSGAMNHLYLFIVTVKMTSRQDTLMWLGDTPSILQQSIQDSSSVEYVAQVNYFVHLVFLFYPVL